MTSSGKLDKLRVLHGITPQKNFTLKHYLTVLVRGNIYDTDDMRNLYDLMKPLDIPPATLSYTHNIPNLFISFHAMTLRSILMCSWIEIYETLLEIYYGQEIADAILQRTLGIASLPEKFPALQTEFNFK